MQRVKLLDQLYHEKRRNEILNREIAEFKECTFVPKVNAAPTFIRKLAVDQKKWKNIKLETQPKRIEKPQWI
jgi:hypothetical protein